MRFNRVTLCELAAMRPGHFRLLLHHGQLPSTDDGGDRFDWTAIIHIAVMQALMSECNLGTGFTAPVALAIAAETRGFLDRFLAAPSSARDFYIGVALVRFESSAADEVSIGVGGTLADVAAQIERERADMRGVTARVVAVNLTEIIRQVRGRAQRANIVFPTLAAAA